MKENIKKDFALLGFDAFINEKKGIHPAVRKHLMDFFKKKKDGSFKEAQAYIKTKMKTWKLTKDDYNEAKSLNEAANMGSIMSLSDKLEMAYEQLGEILDMMSTDSLSPEYEEKAHSICNDIKTLYSAVNEMEDEMEMEEFEGDFSPEDNADMDFDLDDDDFEDDPIY